MELEEEKIKIRKYVIIGIVILLVIIFIVTIGNIFKKDKVKASNFIKQATSYTIPGTKISSYMPTIVIDSMDAKKVNEEITSDFNVATRGRNSSFNYQYSVNDKYFSVVTITHVVDADTGYTYPIFKTYNFSLETKDLVSDEELLNDFDKTDTDISLSLENKMKEYYQGELDKLYLNKSECDYSCFLERRKITSYVDDNYLYVENNKLKFFHSFMIFSNIGEEKFYENETFLFNID